ncbi:hypothetical protein ACFWZ4_10405 [Frateuria sp. GZRe12]|uniref:hypothetical protein n=1 Tax=Frateuria sp. GZRe12 TaxID=3351533 RepID=UPI003EDBFC28
MENLVVEFEARCELYAPHANSCTEVASRIRKLDLSTSQEASITSIIRLAVAETMYGMLCGIEGFASIGNTQGSYQLTDESGHILTGALDSLFFERVPELCGT